MLECGDITQDELDAMDIDPGMEDDYELYEPIDDEEEDYGSDSIIDKKGIGITGDYELDEEDGTDDE